MDKKFIPLSVPNLAGNEWKYVKDCLDTNWISAVGSYVNKFEEQCAKYCDTQFAVGCVNGSAALHISLLLAGVKPNEYVIVPNITFVASANSVKYCFAEPIFMDCDEQTWLMDLELLEEFLTQNTFHKAGKTYLKKDNKRIAAIMPVHILGNVTNLTKLNEIAGAFNLPVVEDATESMGSTHNNKAAGSFGLLGCLSFNGNKIMSTGGGGMILTNDSRLAARAKHITTQAKSDALEYIHDDTGYNYRLVNVLAALGLAQLEQMPQFLEHKKNTLSFYTNALTGVGDISFQKTELYCVPNNWLITIRTKNKKDLLHYLNELQIQCRSLWVPMNELPMHTKNIYYSKSNISKILYNECLSIPCSSNITNDDLQLVCDAIKLFFTDSNT